jgi:hypothetical protein
MKPKTLELVTRHGNSLLAAFPEATEQNPVNLCRKLRRIEAKAHRFATDYCNGHISPSEDSDIDAAKEKFLAPVRKLLGLSESKAQEIGLFVNLDCRGYALKLSDDWTRGYNSTAENRIHADWGGHAILAPDLN